MAKIIHVLAPLLLLLAVGVQSVSTQRVIDNLNDLTAFRSQQHHGYVLLQWYVNTCLNNDMTLQTTCTSQNRYYTNYGFHVFYNNGSPDHPSILPALTRGYRYDTVGNLHLGLLLPHAVTRFYLEHNRNPIFNRDRLVMSYNPSTNTVDQIYITDHYSRTNTFRVGPNLINALRRLGPLNRWRSYYFKPATVLRNRQFTTVIVRIIFVH